MLAARSAVLLTYFATLAFAVDAAHARRRRARDAAAVELRNELRRRAGSQRTARDGSAGFHGSVRDRWPRRRAARRLATRLRTTRKAASGRTATRFRKRCSASACSRIGSNFASIGTMPSSATDIGGVVDTVSGAEDLTLGCQDRADAAGMHSAGNGDHPADVGADGRPTHSRPTKCCPASTICTAGTSTKIGRSAARPASTRSTDDETTDTYSEFSQSFTLGHSWSDRVGSYMRVVRSVAGECRHESAGELFQRRIHVAHQQRRAMGHPRGRGAQRSGG